MLVGLNDDKVHCYDLEEKKLLRSVELGDGGLGASRHLTRSELQLEEMMEDCM